MLRSAAGLCRRSEAGALEALYSRWIAAQESHTPCATKWRLRGFAEGPGDPGPTTTPREPTQRVLDLVDGVENLTVKELVTFNKILQERFGISDAELHGAPMAAAPAAPAAAAAPAEEVKEEKTAFDVVIESYEATSKIKIIKEVRALTPGLGLKEGKELVEKLPAEIKKGISKADADEIEKKLTALGATVKIA